MNTKGYVWWKIPTDDETLVASLDLEYSHQENSLRSLIAMKEVIRDGETTCRSAARDR